MVTVKEGMTIDFTGAKKGSGSRGPYAFVEVKAEKGYDKIKIWATNPEDAAGIEKAAKIGKIESVKLGGHQYNGKWYSDYEINAQLLQGSEEEVIYTAVELTVSDDDLPFA